MFFWRAILPVPLAVTVKSSSLPPFLVSEACIRLWRRCPADAASPKKTGAQSHCALELVCAAFDCASTTCCCLWTGPDSRRLQRLLLGA